jgi:hypothetical protein
VTVSVSVWRDIREPITRRLLFRYDPGRRLVQIKRSGGDVVLIDLEELDRETRPSLPTTDVER